MAAKATTTRTMTGTKATTTTVTAKKSTATKATAKKSTTTKAPATKSTAKKATPKKATPKKSTAKKSTPKKSTAKKSTAQAAAAMAVKPDEQPWSATELGELRAEIEAHIAQLEEEIAEGEAELFDLMHDSGDGAGDDQDDAGAKTYEREQEISLANARDLLDQNRRALERMDDASYGICESCGNPIGKLRLQAAPRATLCMPCKTKEERR